MKIIVTGGAGFIGSYTIEKLHELSYTVLNYDLVNGDDIRHFHKLCNIIEEGDKILHLAAVSRFNSADEDPPRAYSTNVGGTANILQAARGRKAERVILASTGSVYMPIQKTPITEEHPVRGNSHYAISKLMGEQMLQMYCPPYIILRYAHIYGEGKHHGGLVDTFIDRIKRGINPIMYGGFQSNDFCYVKDIVHANILALETEYINEIYNIGTGEAISTEKAFDILKELTGYKGKIDKMELRLIDAHNFVYDISKAKRLLKYVPNYSFEQGLIDMKLQNSFKT